ncbi:MAG: beta-ketoacyl synthase N-terminal-like domain-containing protein [Planctomycetia bacterium]|nr:beta-ketoacyl synthase N-terminal-like domain-containing protein [Planctomycetia bacterium]
MSDFTPIAITGIACRLPGGENVDSFWSMVRRGGSKLGPIPESRFNRELYYDPTPGVLNKTYTDLAGLIEYGPIDRTLCPLPPGAEKFYDIAHLAFAESVSSACRNAGIDPFHFPEENTGIFIGHTRPGTISQQWNYQICLPEIIDYLNEVPGFASNVPSDKKRQILEKIARDTIARLEPLPGGIRPFYLSSDITQLVSQMLHTNGPNMVFNSACASSLHAVSQAIFALQHHRIDMAVAGGSTFFHQDTLLLFASSRSMTKKRSCPFDKEADGLIIGEGNVVFLLKRLEDALRDHDTVKAVFTGVGIASDGKGKSLWAPRKEGQIEAIKKAYANTEEMRKVDYIEAHATSTALGDATELEALNSVFGELLQGRKVPLGSAKGNIGHTLEVAGAAGILKAVLALKNGIVPPVGGLRNLNPNIPWAEIPFIAPMKESPFEKPKDFRPRRAAVNSFGIGGLNVHLVLDEFLPEYWEEKYPASRKRSSVSTGSPANPQTVSAAMIPASNQEPVAIVGFGCILPDAYSAESWHKMLESGANAFKEVPKKVWNHRLFSETYMKERYGVVPEFKAGVIDQYVYDWKKNKVPPKQVLNASPIQFMMLDAANEAFSTFGKTPNEVRERTGVVVGTMFGGDFSNKMNVVLSLPTFLDDLKKILKEAGIPDSTSDSLLKDYAALLHKKMPALLDETGSFTPSALASRITKTLDLMGGAVAVESEKGSCGAAILCCIDQLQAHENDLMVCIGGEQDLAPSVFEILFSHGFYANHPEISPFDQKNEGYVPGEGCGVLILKRLADAKKDGDTVYGIINGIGTGSGMSVYENVKTSAQRAGANTAPQIAEAPFCGDPEYDAAVVDAIADLRERQNSPVNGKTILGSVIHQIGYFSTGSSMGSLLKILYELGQKKALADHTLKDLAPWFKRYENLITVPVKSEPLSGDGSNAVALITGQNCLYYISIESMR